jgi:alpha-L-fucosidase
VRHNAIPTLVFDWQAWEVPATLNDTWGFKKDDHNWKEPKDLIYKLTDIVSKGGNYLLNVGPTAEGVIPQESQDILRAMGEWLKVNGEAIYGTGHSPFIYKDITWKCTSKPGRLFFHIVNWPGNQLTIEGLESSVDEVWFLKNREAVDYSQNGNQLTLSLPDEPLDSFNTVVVVEIADEQPVVTAGFAYNDVQQSYSLFSRDARIRGEEAGYDWANHSVSGFVAADTPENELWWYHFPYESGTYSVSVEYSCDDELAGSDFYVSNRRDRGRPVTLEGRIEPTQERFKVFHVGELELTEGAENQLRFGLGADDQSAELKVRKLVLTKQ